MNTEPMADRRLRVGVDVGGTFTDLAALDDAGTLHRLKLFSTPHDPSRAVLEGLDRLLGQLRTGEGASRPVIGEVVHGSTVATNAVLERKGARTAFVTTRGFRDLLALARQDRPDLFDFGSRRPAPLVPEDLCFEVAERVAPTGEVLEPLEEESLSRLVESLRLARVESVAVCLLFSFVRPDHEQRIGAALRKAGFHVSLSSEVLPEFREYERASTTVIDAYVAPALDRYLARLERRLPGSRLRIMLSNGGSAGPEVARSEAVRSILSGPAAGVVGALQVAGTAGSPRVIAFDMGGTSTDVALLDGAIPSTAEGSIAGLPVRVPMVDIHTVGSGGGSIARLDAGGALRVGPESAGAMPGPVCYGRGGAQPTVTDANVVLGRLPADRFLGGAHPVDEEAAMRTLARLGQAAGLDARGAEAEGVARLAALGVVRVANARMERALRAITVERGHDPEDFALVSFGGAGGLHACELARALGIRVVLVPPSASVLSAFGMLAADVVKDYVRTVMWSEEAPFAEIDVACRRLEARGRDDLVADEVASDRIGLRSALDLRYEGQGFEIGVPLTPDFVARFHAEHERLYGHSDPTAPIELVNLRVRATGRVAGATLSPHPGPAAAGPPPAVERRPVVIGLAAGDATGDTAGDATGAAVELDVRDAPVYEHDGLRPGHEIEGPAVVVAADTTVWLGPAEHAAVDRHGNLVVRVGRWR